MLNKLKPEIESKSVDDINEIYATVYSCENSLLCEAVIIGDIPCFIKVENNNKNGKREKPVQIHIETEVPLIWNELLLPLPSKLYMSRPYVFKSEKEFYKLVEKVRHETLDSLYQKVKAQWDLYIDNGKEHNIMCATTDVDLFGSYETSEFITRMRNEGEKYLHRSNYFFARIHNKFRIK